MKIVIAGRPNTGKSTLFNALTRSRDALVHDRPGVTRDAIGGILQIDDVSHQIFDTAGLESKTNEIGKMSTDVAINVIKDADVVLFVVDGRAGLHSDDMNWSRTVKRNAKGKILLLLNKAESKKGLENSAEFYKLGLGEPHPVSAEHKLGFDGIYEFITKNDTPAKKTSLLNPKLRISIMGQPNVGKSTLVNQILGENRVIVQDQPGVTRDAVKINTKFYGREITLVDTAGLRRKAHITDELETLSALKSLGELDHTDVVILVVDSTKDIENQAFGIAARIYDAGKIFCLALNKWDLVSNAEREEKLLKLKHQFANSFHQIIKPMVLAISAETGTGVKNMFKRIYELWDISNSRIPTSVLNKTIEKLIEARSPPMSRLKRPMKIKFATQISEHPVRIIINVGGASDIPESYTRYLRRGLAKALKQEQLPIFIEYKKSENPFGN